MSGREIADDDDDRIGIGAEPIRETFYSSLEMTRRYVKFLDEDLKAAHLRFSPGDRL